ncbi:hypothetical protein GCM10012289_48250 [Nonomuraea cavernae]|uniref:Uncharacterized protein n=1 Tax=Nonomuraea cavernae TaxID=2045107 RepID=A0A917Z5U2_9ACTN|nr:hypothetical protein GCM10012289_48250 [Nonomuraea cavernae]
MRRAILLPVVSQKVSSSGCHSSSQRAIVPSYAPLQDRERRKGRLRALTPRGRAPVTGDAPL